MTFTVGGVDVTAVHVGATPAEAVYAGDVKVWPASGPSKTWRYRLADWASHISVDGDGTLAMSFNRLNVDTTDLDGQNLPERPWDSVVGHGKPNVLTLSTSDGTVHYTGAGDNGHPQGPGAGLLITLNPKPDYNTLQAAIGIGNDVLMTITGV